MQLEPNQPRKEGVKEAEPTSEEIQAEIMALGNLLEDVQDKAEEERLELEEQVKDWSSKHREVLSLPPFPRDTFSERVAKNIEKRMVELEIDNLLPEVSDTIQNLEKQGDREYFLDRAKKDPDFAVESFSKAIREPNPQDYLSQKGIALRQELNSLFNDQKKLQQQYPDYRTGIEEKMALEKKMDQVRTEYLQEEAAAMTSPEYQKDNEALMGISGREQLVDRMNRVGQGYISK